ncbi:RNA polymerase subunit sigma-70 [bacterium]|nr:RNA polymerase subunit sigma-70 [bacterium]
MFENQVTMHLQSFRDGDQSALDRIVPLLYKDLKRMAAGQLRRGAPAMTLGATGLVHELYLKLLGQEGLDSRDRDHFLAISARAMRQVLADGARRRTAAKRGGGQAMVTFEEDMALADEDAAWLTDLDDALTRLAQVNERLARVVECRFFGGLSEAETAAALDSSLRTVQRDWMRARAWLQAELGSAPEVGPS